MKENKTRNDEIYAKKLEGRTDYGLAMEYELHPNTIRQIISRYKMREQLEAVKPLAVDTQTQ